MIRENQKVKTLVEKDGFKIGTLGVVVSVYSSGPACEVELWDENKYPVDVITYRFDELSVINED